MEFSINMKQMNRWKVDQDNVFYFDHIMKNDGKFFALYVHDYIHLLHEFDIDFTTK